MTDDSPDTDTLGAHETSDQNQNLATQTVTEQPPPPEPNDRETDSEHEASGEHIKGNDDDDGEEGNEDEEGDEGDEGDEEDDENEEDEEDEDDEPKLKYARLTQHLSAVYRNGDATSSFLVAGDKMIIGTHNGNIHVIQVPIFQPLRVYHAHSASVTSLSISPYPPPLPSPSVKPDAAARVAATSGPLRPGSRTSDSQSSPAAASRKPREISAVPNTPSNNIYIATSSLDGNVCVQSLVDVKDVQLRNFSRPVQAVALSPDFKNDRTYLSGGPAGQLILTVGAPPGRSTSTTTGASAQAAGWLGSMVGASMGKDTVLHSGEGTINTIKWSLSGKYVVWLNEHGIKIMRSKLHLESADAEDAWKRIGHVDRPETEEWEAMASVWKGRAEWIDEQALEPDENGSETQEGTVSSASEKLKQQQLKAKKQIERLLVGWGGTIWIIHVHPGGIGVGKDAGERSAGRAEIIKILRMDCIISGISLYTPSLLLVLAYCRPDSDENEDAAEVTRGHKHTVSASSKESQPSGGIRRRQNNQPPELRLIDLNSQAEIDKDGLNVSRFERLNATDYHLAVLPAQNVAAAASSRGALETLAGLGTDMWNVAINSRALFSSGASTRSRGSSDGTSLSGSNVPSGAGTVSAQRVSHHPPVHPHLAKPGIKIFIHSPYDCILATKRDLSDHLAWLLERKEYQEAWQLVDEHPEIMTGGDKLPDVLPGTPDRSQHDDFYDETASVIDGRRNFYSSAEKEKRRIGELWLQELMEAGDWIQAGRICGKVLGTPDRWEKWAWTFAGANKFDEIANYIPTEPMRPPIPGTIYEVMLEHYLQTDKPRFRDLLDRWSPDLFNINTITTALENQLRFRDVREDSVEDGEVGRDWRIVMECLARLHEANGRNREALRCYIKLQDADSAMRLIRDSHLADAVADDIPSFINLRVPRDRINRMTKDELERATVEAVTLLVDEAQHGLVKPDVVVTQLQQKELNLYIYFYLRGLWKGEGIYEHTGELRARLLSDSQALVDQFADLAVHIFATYDQALLMDFLKTSTAYSFGEAVRECERFNYIPELVYLYSKTGQMKRALYLIIDRLGDVRRAIAFAKEQDDPDLWEDLLDYSMDKPRFIRGLLDQVGTAINPITLLRRIPEGLEIEGLREGLKHMMKDHEIQFSISSGVARVLRSEVAAAQAQLRNGQRKGIKFAVVIHADDHVDVETKNVTPSPGNPAQKDGQTEGDHTADGASVDGPEQGDVSSRKNSIVADKQRTLRSRALKKWQPGHCAQCLEPFTEWEAKTLVGFACSHVFHLPHLLELLRPGTGADDDDVLEPVEMSTPRVVGAKVTHARLLRDRIGEGCPVCKKKEAPA